MLISCKRFQINRLQINHYKNLKLYFFFNWTVPTKPILDNCVFGYFDASYPGCWTYSWICGPQKKALYGKPAHSWTWISPHLPLLPWERHCEGILSVAEFGNSPGVHSDLLHRTWLLTGHLQPVQEWWPEEWDDSAVELSRSCSAPREAWRRWPSSVTRWHQ